MLWPWVIAGVCGLIVLGEVAFRIFLRVRGVHFLPPKTHRNFYIVPHPYLPFVYKANSVVDNTQVAPYPLHRGRYEFKSTRINNIRFSDEDVRSQKQPGTVRVMCLGSSSIASSIWEVGNPKQYSIAICLRESLEQRFGSHRYEVLNCGMGGWTSAEIFINFALHLIDLRPDIVLLYHGLNDLEPSLTTPFASDYSHSRRNLGEVYKKIRIASYVPNLRPWKSFFFLKRALLGFGNIRYDLLRSVRVKKADLNNPFMGLETEQRNIEHLIHLCRANQVQVILATYAYHVYSDVSQDGRTLKYQEGVQGENVMLRDLARRHGLPMVDIAALLPDDDAYFVDTVHFTPLGMHFVVDRFAERISEVLMDRTSFRDRAEQEARV